MKKSQLKPGDLVVVDVRSHKRTDRDAYRSERALVVVEKLCPDRSEREEGVSRGKFAWTQSHRGTLDRPLWIGRVPTESTPDIDLVRSAFATAYVPGERLYFESREALMEIAEAVERASEAAALQGRRAEFDEKWAILHKLAASPHRIGGMVDLRLTNEPSEPGARLTFRQPLDYARRSGDAFDAVYAEATLRAFTILSESRAKIGGFEIRKVRMPASWTPIAAAAAFHSILGVGGRVLHPESATDLAEYHFAGFEVEGFTVRTGTPESDALIRKLAETVLNDLVPMFEAALAEEA